MDNFRKIYLMVAEMIDALRIIPRAMVAGYAYLLGITFDWYFRLEPYFPKDVIPMLNQLAKTSGDVSVLLVQAPTTQHTAALTAIIGFASAVFGLYTATGIKWGEYEFKFWPKINERRAIKKAANEDTNDSA